MRYFITLCSTVLLFSCGAGSDKPAVQGKLLNQHGMEAIIQHKVFFENIPSASGLERIGNSYFINGDDSPFLYLLDEQYKLTKRLSLFDTSEFKNGRIPKPLKPDLESMATFKYKNKQYLLLLGSGSSSARQKAYLAEVPAATAEILEANPVSLEGLYQTLQKNKKIIGQDVLNIEGFAADEQNVYLLQRAIAKGSNVVIKYELESFAAFIVDNGPVPEASYSFFTLPELQEYQAGFSGATVFDDKLFFSASIESTANAIDDGEVLGSFVGYIPLNKLSAATNAPATADAALLQSKDGSTYKGKAESVVVKEKSSSGNYKLIVVTDDDEGHSEVLEVEAVL